MTLPKRTPVKKISNHNKSHSLIPSINIDLSYDDEPIRTKRKERE